MASVPVHCRHGQGVDGVRYGTQRKGEQRYGCHHVDGPRHILRLS
jgi:transposase-like protein